MVAKPLTGRVGKHRDGRQAQNNKADQESVITLLNMIPVADGGTAGALQTRTVNGLASRALLKAIDAYQKKQVPGQVTGIIEPGGNQYMQMAVLAGRPPAVTGGSATAAGPPKAPLRPGLSSQIVSTRVTEGLAGDNLLSHAEVVNIIRSTVHDGILTQDEINDLSWVAAHEKMAEPRSKELLETFVKSVGKDVFGAGPYEIRGQKRRDAAELAFAFLERTGPNAFSRLSRNTVGVEMLLRIAKPGLLKQDQSSLCGPTSMLFNLLSDHPERYAQFAVSLYESGRATVGTLSIIPNEGVKNYTPPGTMAQVDWMTMASIRDSENFCATTM